MPSGILLCGPPGTGKTLMAEAVAGETGRPFVFVDPGAFIQMFMGVGVLKVKALFRKLRKLALRYGGVIVFFDEADSLGNRGAARAGRAGRRSDRPAGTVLAVDRTASDHLRWLSPESQSAILSASAAPSSLDGSPPRTVDRIIMGGMGGGRHGHAAGAAVRAVRPEEAPGLRQPLRPARCSACGPSRRPSTASS